MYKIPQEVAYEKETQNLKQIIINVFVNNKKPVFSNLNKDMKKLEYNHVNLRLMWYSSGRQMMVQMFSQK